MQKKIDFFPDEKHTECHSCLNTFSNDIQDGFLVFDETGSLLFLNNKAKTIFGYEDVDLQGLDISMLIPVIAKDRLEESITSLNNAARIETLRYGSEMLARQHNGAEFPVDIAVRKVEQKQGTVFFCYFSDISNRKKMEQQAWSEHNQQVLINDLLKISLSDVSLDEQLEMILEKILDTPWLSKEKSGCIFLMEPGSGKLQMKASHGMAPKIIELCATVPLGECLCGQAAQTRETIFGAMSNEPHRHLQSNARLKDQCCIPIYSQAETLGVITLYLRSGFQKDDRNQEYFKMIGGTLAGVIKRKQAEEQTIKVLRENRVLTARLIQAQEEERKKLAREMHDELGQSVTAIKTEAVLIGRYNDNENKDIAESAESITNVAGHIYDVSHSIIQRMRPNALDDFGLVDTLQNCIKDWLLKRTGIACRLETEGEVGDFSEEINITLLRILQECLTNVIRHAAATQVDVLLCRDSGHDQKENDSFDYIVLEVTDNGRGLAKGMDSGVNMKFGLVGIRERVEGLGGSLELEGKPGRGFRVIANIPLFR